MFYGASQILFGVDFAIREGQTMALLGRNGAGKSTTMKAIAGLAPPKRGTVSLFGQDRTRQKPHEMARAGLGFVPEDRQVFPEHSVEDNLLIAHKPGPDGRDEWSLKRIYDVFPLLTPLRQRMAGRLSGGEQQMLAIARMLMGNPSVLLLDEPSEGPRPDHRTAHRRTDPHLAKDRGHHPDRRAEHAFLPRPRQRCDRDRQGPDRLPWLDRGTEGQ